MTENQMTPRETLAALAAPFSADAISWRVGSMTADKSKGMALGYVDARDVMRRLDDVMGADWQCEYVPMPNGTCCCRIGLKIDGEWRWRANGALNISDSEKVDAKEMAEKASYSDAFKRAAVLWGIGQSLYDLPNVWVELEARGRTHVIPEREMGKLRVALSRIGAPASPPHIPAVERDPPARNAVQPAGDRRTSGEVRPDPKAVALAAKSKAAEMHAKDSAEIKAALIGHLSKMSPGATTFDATWGVYWQTRTASYPRLTTSDKAVISEAEGRRTKAHKAELEKQRQEAA